MLRLGIQELLCQGGLVIDCSIGNTLYLYPHSEREADDNSRPCCSALTQSSIGSLN